MATKLLAFCGSKQSGKGVSASYATALVWRAAGKINEFYLDDTGQIIIKDCCGKKLSKDMVLDTVDYNVEPELADILGQMQNPDPMQLVQHESLAAPLKEMMTEVLGIPRQLVRGNEQARNYQTYYTIGQLRPLVGNGPFAGRTDDTRLTVREMMQLIGTDIFRKIDPNIWAGRLEERIYGTIEAYHPILIVVTDVRFEEERVMIQDKLGGCLIGLTRRPFVDGHASENVSALVGKCNYVIDNANMSIEQQCAALFPILSQVLQ